MDAARQGYWTRVWWLARDDLPAGCRSPTQMRERGLGDAELHQLFVTGPGPAYSFSGGGPDDRRRDRRPVPSRLR